MLFFIDESGHDRKEAPYEVLAGVAIREHDIWNLIQAIRNAELKFSGLHMAKVGLELKGRKLLKRKIIRFAGEGAAIEPNQRRELVRNLLEKGRQRTQGETVEGVKSADLVAYGQAVFAFVKRVFEIAGRYNAKNFAGIVYQKKQFSIRKFGEEKAKKTGDQARRKGVRNMQKNSNCAPVAALERRQAETIAELDALFPALLDRALKGES